ncbi:hypothetical protein RN02_06390 [Pseudomonas sp. PI1]|nr:hypothetical protein RN02_06390 [Pseudomonas sp. PI1]
MAEDRLAPLQIAADALEVDDARRPILAVGMVLVSTQPRTTSSVISSRPSIWAKTAWEQNGAERKSEIFSAAPVTANPHYSRLFHGFAL